MEMFKAYAKVNNFWSFVGRYLKYAAIGALTALGAYFGKEWFS